MEEEMKYEEAVAQLEQIVNQIENNELGIDELTDKLKQAQKLLKMCKDKLYKTSKEIEKLLSEE